MRGGEYYSADCAAEIESAVVCEYTPPVENKKDEDCLNCGITGHLACMCWRAPNPQRVARNKGEGKDKCDGVCQGG